MGWTCLLVPSYEEGEKHRGVKQPLDNSTKCLQSVWHRKQCFQITPPRKNTVTEKNGEDNQRCTARMRTVLRNQAHYSLNEAWQTFRGKKKKTRKRKPL